MLITNNHDVHKRADVLLAEVNTKYSRASLAKLFDMNKVSSNDKVIKAGDKIQPGLSFTVDISPINAPAEEIDLPIIFEDKNVIVINKPAGIISHARGRYWDEASVASFVRQKVSDMTGERAGIVHRLDRATSGVMICAKNQETLSFLQKQFSVRKVRKKYTAIVIGMPSLPKATIDVPLARNPKEPNTFRPDDEGKACITNYSVGKKNDKYSLLNLEPLTGRTHQLRVHLKYIKHPIVGDFLYGGEKADRLYLHANSLEITIPGGERKIFTAPLPQAFSELIIK